MLFHTTDTRQVSRLASSLIAVGLMGMVGAAVAADGVVQDRRVDDQRYELAIEQLAATSPLEVTDHAKVREQLDRYLGTPDGRRFVAEALERYVDHADDIEAAARRHGVPSQVAAIAFIESGFSNHDQWAFPSAEEEARYSWRGAGMWMFIPATARTYGMAVSSEVDERLDIPRETEAAMRYLAREADHFGSWLLAFASYNQGRRAVTAAIAEAGTDDPWTLIGDDHLNDYVPAVVAAALILEDRTLR